MSGAHRTHLLDDLEVLLAAGLRADARRAGLHESSARVLLALDPASGLAMGEVARRIGRDPSTTTRFVDAAAARGLVERIPAADRRRRLATLTPRGLATREALLLLRARRADAVPRSVQARTGLGAEEVDWFLGALVEAIRPRGEPPATGGEPRAPAATTGGAGEGRGRPTRQ